MLFRKSLLFVSFTLLQFYSISQTEIEAEPVFEFPDVEASFPGGYDSLSRWINRNIEYPSGSIEKGEQGRVYVAFVVEVDGSLSSIKIERGAFPLLDAEVLRLVGSMPNWIPGEMGEGKKCRTRFRLPVNFTLDFDEEPSDKKKRRGKKG